MLAQSLNTGALVFWSSALFVVYVYLGYPLALALWARRRTVSPAPVPPRWPSVAVVMAAHNERHRLPAKLRCLRALDYPRENLTIYCVSDGSDDGTVEYLASQPDVRLAALARRSGKPAALNHVLELVTEEVVVFMDVRQLVAADAIKRLVARLLTAGVGAVSGELVHRSPDSEVGRSVGLYWRYEKWIRKNESRVHSVPGVTGALYAIRRRDYVPLREDTILDDFEVPMQILRRGKRVLLEEAAYAYDEVQESIRRERIRKVRTLAGNFQAFARNPWLFNPLKNPIFFQFVSHKVLRLLVPYALALCLGAAWVMEGTLYQVMFWLQAGFYSAAMAGLAFPSLRENRLLSFAAVFVELNLAAVIGLLHYLGGKTDARWART